MEGNGIDIVLVYWRVVDARGISSKNGKYRATMEMDLRPSGSEGLVISSAGLLVYIRYGYRGKHSQIPPNLILHGHP